MTHNHTTEMIQAYEKKINDAELIRAKAEARRGALQDQYNDTNRELELLGVNPKESQQALNALTKEIEDGLKELEALIPFDAITQYNS